MARGVSSPAGDDKGSSPLTSAAFLKNCCTKKLLILLLQKIYSRYTIGISKGVYRPLAGVKGTTSP
jgi:hypothetical protein